MSSVPPGQGPAPQLDPSGQWQWSPEQQQWLPAQGTHGAQAGQAQPAAETSSPGQDSSPGQAAQSAQPDHGYQQPDQDVAPGQSDAPGQGYPTAGQGFAPPPAGYQQPAQATAQPGQSYSPGPYQPGQPGQPGYQPGYGPGPAYPAGPGYPGGPTGAQPKSRRTIFIAAAVVVVVVAGVLIGVLAFGGGGSKSSAKNPSAIVKTYLNDLAKGDASGALAQGVAPLSATFVTADILKQQQAKDKISNIKIGSTQTSGADSEVQASYQFGPRTADETFRLTKTGGKWKLTDTTFQIDVSLLTEIPQLTLFGTPVGNLSKVYVFPGPLTWGSQSTYYSVTEKDANQFALSPFDESAAFTELTPDLNAAGKQAVQTAVQTAFTTCAASKMLAPPNCPQREDGLTDDTGLPKDGTVTWTAPTDLSGLQYSSAGEATKLDVSGSTTWKATYKSESFTNNKVTTITDSSVKVDVFGTVDLGQSPPVFTQD